MEGHRVVCTDTPANLPRSHGASRSRRSTLGLDAWPSARSPGTRCRDTDWSRGHEAAASSRPPKGKESRYHSNGRRNSQAGSCAEGAANGREKFLLRFAYSGLFVLGAMISGKAVGQERIAGSTPAASPPTPAAASGDEELARRVADFKRAWGPNWRIRWEGDRLRTLLPDPLGAGPVFPPPDLARFLGDLARLSDVAAAQLQPLPPFATNDLLRYSYQQTTASLPIEGAGLVIHLGAGEKLLVVSSTAVPNPKPRGQQKITPNEAAAVARSFVGEPAASPDVALSTSLLYLPSNTGRDVVLAWKVNLFNDKATLAVDVYIDAETKQVLDFRNLVSHHRGTSRGRER